MIEWVVGRGSCWFCGGLAGLVGLTGWGKSNERKERGCSVLWSKKKTTTRGQEGREGESERLVGWAVELVGVYHQIKQTGIFTEKRE